MLALVDKNMYITCATPLLVMARSSFSMSPKYCLLLHFPLLLTLLSLRYLCLLPSPLHYFFPLPVSPLHSSLRSLDPCLCVPTCVSKTSPLSTLHRLLYCLGSSFLPLRHDKHFNNRLRTKDGTSTISDACLFKICTCATSADFRATCIMSSSVRFCCCSCSCRPSPFSVS